MSFVSVIARENFINVMSDGRVTSVDNVPIQEDYQKFINVGENLFLAYAGSKEPTEILINVLKQLNLLDKFNDLPIETVANLVKSSIESTQLKRFKILLAMGGISKTNEVEFFYYNSTNSDLQIYKPKGSDINYCFLHNGRLDEINTEQVLVNALRRHGLDLSEQIMRSQKELNDMVASVDKSVNTNTFELSIKKQ